MVTDEVRTHAWLAIVRVLGTRQRRSTISQFYYFTFEGEPILTLAPKMVEHLKKQTYKSYSNLSAYWISGIYIELFKTIYECNIHK